MFRSASLSCDPASFFENKEAGGRKKQASVSSHPLRQRELKAEVAVMNSYWKLLTHSCFSTASNPYFLNPFR